MSIYWNNPEFKPLVEKGKEEPFWIAVKNDKGKVFVFMAYYQNRPLDEDNEWHLLNEDDCLHNMNGEPVGSVGWVDEKQHDYFDDYWEAFNFNENYQLLGWAVYTPPEFTGIKS